MKISLEKCNYYIKKYWLNAKLYTKEGIAGGNVIRRENKTKQKANINPTISIITLNENESNSATKKLRLNFKKWSNL